jgi:hypothetical protein
MTSQKRHIKSILTLTVLAVSILLGSCRRPVYYSSTRVYNARVAQNKKLKKRGYSNQQYKKSNRKTKKWSQNNNFRKRQHKGSSSNKSGRK